MDTDYRHGGFFSYSFGNQNGFPLKICLIEAEYMVSFLLQIPKYNIYLCMCATKLTRSVWQDRVRYAGRCSISSPYSERDINICSPPSAVKDIDKRAEGKTSSRCHL